jgi:hypothetical protein
MLTPIPGFLTQRAVAEILLEHTAGVYGHFDFFYCPWDLNADRNMGYAVINLETYEGAVRFQRHWEGRPLLEGSQPLRVLPAHHQGRLALLQHFSSSSPLVRTSASEQLKPLEFEAPMMKQHMDMPQMMGTAAGDACLGQVAAGPPQMQAVAQAPPEGSPTALRQQHYGSFGWPPGGAVTFGCPMGAQTPLLPCNPARSGAASICIVPTQMGGNAGYVTGGYPDSPANQAFINAQGISQQCSPHGGGQGMQMPQRPWENSPCSNSLYSGCGQVWCVQKGGPMPQAPQGAPCSPAQGGCQYQVADGSPMQGGYQAQPASGGCQLMGADCSTMPGGYSYSDPSCCMQQHLRQPASPRQQQQHRQANKNLCVFAPV